MPEILKVPEFFIPFTFVQAVRHLTNGIDELKSYRLVTYVIYWMERHF